MRDCRRLFAPPSPGDLSPVTTCTPSTVVTDPDGSLPERPIIGVDSSEFVVSTLRDRGTHQAFGVVTNAQDFMHILRLHVERQLDLRAAVAGGAPLAGGAR